MSDSSQSKLLPFAPTPRRPAALATIRPSTLIILAGAVSLVIYLLVALVMVPPGALWSPDEGAKLLQVQNLRLHDGRLDLAIDYTGHDLDPALEFAQPHAEGLLRQRDGALYFQRLPIFPLLTQPFFKAFGMSGIYLLPALAGAACCVLSLLLVAPAQRRFATWLLIAFGSPIFVYASLFWEHTIATAIALAGTLVMLRNAPLTRSINNVLLWLIAGFLLALSVYLRMELILFVGPLLAACWLLAPSGRWGPMLAGVLCVLLLVPYVPLHNVLFGQPVADNALYLLYPFVYLHDAGLRAVPDLLIGPFADGSLYTGWIGVVWAWAAVVALLAWFVSGPRWLRWIGWGALGVTAVVAVAFLFTPTPYRSAHGLLFTTPWALFGLCRSRDVWRHGDRSTRVLALTVWLGLIAYVLGIIVFRASSPHGGLEWGMRFALTFYPILALFTLWPERENAPRSFAPAVVALLICLGIGFQLRGLLTIRHDKQINGALNATLATLPEHEVVSDLPWITLNAAPIYRQKATFEIASAERIGQWITLAADHGIERFCLVTLDESLPDRIAVSLPDRRLNVIAVHRIENLRVIQIASAPR